MWKKVNGKKNTPNLLIKKKKEAHTKKNTLTDHSEEKSEKTSRKVETEEQLNILKKCITPFT